MSTLKADTIQNTSGGAATLTKQVAAKGWVDIDAAGTLEVKASFNVSSVDDNGTGDHDINYTNNFSSADDYAYAGAGYASTVGTNARSVKTSSDVNLDVFHITDVRADRDPLCVILVGDLA